MTTRVLRVLAALTFAFAAPFAFAAEAASAASYEEKSLLTSDGTLYVVRSGSGVDLGVVGGAVGPSDKLIEWSARTQDGSVSSGILPDTVNSDAKRNLDLAYDEPSQSLVLLWNEEVTILNVLRLGIFKGGTWTVGNLLPNIGFPRAYNPQMLLSHQTVSFQDSNGNPTTQRRTLLSVIWWEDNNNAQARYAPIFLDDDPSTIQVYDLPSLVGNVAGSTAPAAHPAGSYMYPSLQLEGIGGGLLASFVDLNANKQYVVRITFPDNLGRPGPDNLTWQRRRIPVVGIESEGPIADVPITLENVRVIVGASYRPTLAWQTDTTVGYTRFDGQVWSSTKTIPLSDSMTADRALRLVQDMAMRN